MARTRVAVPEKSVSFYEALGFEKRRKLPIRGEAINIPLPPGRCEVLYLVADT